jgi:hypothetical protein
VAAAPLAAQSRVFEQTVRLEPGGALSLHATKGSVRLIGGEQNQVEIRARIEVDAGDARRLVDTTVDVITTGNRVTIRSNYDKLRQGGLLFGGIWGEIPSIHYEIRAPKRLDLDLYIDRSDLVLAGFSGRIDLDADRSEIDASDLTGPVRISIDRGGDSSLRNIRGSFSVSADRTNMRIDILSLDASSKIRIDRGDADVSLAKGQGLELDTAFSRRADFSTSFPLRFSRRKGESRPSGPINGGGPGLYIDADRSQISLR